MRDHKRLPVLYNLFSTHHSRISILYSPHTWYLALLLLTAAFLASCSKPEERWQVGGLYSVSGGEDQFGIAKILAIDPGVVSVRVYKQKFPKRPKEIDPSTLTLGSLNEEGADFGIGHLPLSPRTFELWFPVFIMKEDVREDELEGYRIWKESGAGLFELDGASKPPDDQTVPPGGSPNAPNG